MRILRKGLTGPDVALWQYFLRGQSKTSRIVANSVFDDFTFEETKAFQESSPGKLTGDGVVGPQTLAKAIKLGYNALSDDSKDESSPAWPKKPPRLKQLGDADRTRLFGAFKFEAAPTPDNPEAIRILDDWAKKNIVSVSLPQIRGIKGASKSGSVQFHKLAAPQLQQAFKALEDRDQLKHLKSWGGTWVPRYIRGSKDRLSNHSWGTALDVNVDWNRLGTLGALKGQEGSVREMVLTLAEYGLYWGNWFTGRSDPMHFEIFKVL
jgi:hypothetical protein